MLIGQLSKQARVPASTIRHYEKRGILPPPVRVGGRRRYKSDSTDLLLVVKLAQAGGFRLDEMKMLVQGFDKTTIPSERWQRLAQKKKQELDAQIERMKVMRALVERVAASGCIDLAECGRTARGGQGNDFVKIGE